MASPRQGLANRIEIHLAYRILSGQLPPGGTVPSQDELVRQFGVSRAVVREAIAALSQRGLLTVHQGRSTHITESVMWNVLDPFLVDIQIQLDSRQSLLQDLFVVRLVVEPEVAAMVALKRSPDQLRAVAQTVDRLMAVPASPVKPGLIDANLDFHWQLVQVAGNRVLTGIVRSYQPLLRTQTVDFQPSDLEHIRSQHGTIYRAIESRDAASAREAMRVHLIDARERLF